MSDFRGTVQVNNLNLSQGDFPEVERTLLFVGIALASIGTVTTVNNASDLDLLFGPNDSELKTNLEAAKENAGQNWQAYVMAHPAGSTTADILDLIDIAMNTVSAELIVITTAQNTQQDIESFHTKAMLILGELGRQVGFLVAVESIDVETESWAEYVIRQEDLVDEIAANRVAVIPQLHGNDIGVLAGRLCNRMVSIADSPMRTATGALVGLGETPVDKNGTELGEDTLMALSGARFSTIQHYADYAGTYWADCPMLETPIGDYKVIEYLRIAMKAARASRLLLISKVADRQFNSTPASMEFHKTFFLRPVREMSKSATIGDLTFPGECKPPEDDDMTIVWHDKTTVEMYMKVCPYNSPKSLTMNIILDLTSL